ncbi:hypothetical protein Tco_0817132 [Tanacetum coccineum]
MKKLRQISVKKLTQIAVKKLRQNSVKNLRQNAVKKLRQNAVKKKILPESYALSWKPCQGDSLNLPDHRAQVDQGSQIKMIQVKEMMQDNDLKNLKSKDKGSKSRSQSMDEQSHYKQDKTITRQSINVKRHIFNVIGDTEKVGDVAYKLELPEELSRVHNTFHVSNLKKCHADEPLAVPLDGLHFDDKLQFVEEPIEITDREVKRLKRSRIPLVKVRWNSKRGPEFTWEREDQFRKKYPHLFSKTGPSSSAAS